MHDDTRIPKLDFGTLSERSDGPIYTIAKSTQNAPTNRSSLSTVSWGSDYSNETPRTNPVNEPYRRTRQDHSTSTAQAPKHNEKKTFEREGYTKQLTSKSTSVRHTLSNKENTHQSDKLEYAFKPNTHESQSNIISPYTGNHIGGAEESTYTYADRRTSEKVPTTTVHPSQLGPHLTVKQSMSFTARLSVFNPSDLSACTHVHFRPDLSWTNSISSWSLRSYVGMAFLDDSTWMLNEKHRTGASTSPMPFLPRAVHHCAYGRRNGYPYIPEVDIFPGATLFVQFREAANAPEQLRHFLNHTKGVLRIRICTVDSEKRQRAITFHLTVFRFIKGSRLVFSKSDFVNALGQLMSSSEYVDFSEFEAFYEGFSIALAGCPLDSLTDSDDMENYAAIFGPYGMAYKEEMDRFERLVRGSWGV
ncbi:hypothetical protein CRM22_003671 [Opisthorchis felineus]|uniref:Calcyphosin-2 PH domain-containing protein n=1 Tax=Opisthorchis felineus TaxID=147828 RepID=A0A4S2M062_OPIFE|nr:hypothetical protein CRM22_003671 [Opisthorchis felineus]